MSLTADQISGARVELCRVAMNQPRGWRGFSTCDLYQRCASIGLPVATSSHPGMAVVCISERKFKEAVDWAERALLQNRNFGLAQRALAVALVNVGEIDRARGVVKKLLAVDPSLTGSELRRRFFARGTLQETYLDALHIAGLPD